MQDVQEGNEIEIGLPGKGLTEEGESIGQPYGGKDCRKIRSEYNHQPFPLSCYLTKDEKEQGRKINNGWYHINKNQEKTVHSENLLKNIDDATGKMGSKK